MLHGNLAIVLFAHAMWEGLAFCRNLYGWICVTIDCKRLDILFLVILCIYLKVLWKITFVSVFFFKINCVVYYDMSMGWHLTWIFSMGYLQLHLSWWFSEQERLPVHSGNLRLKGIWKMSWPTYKPLPSCKSVVVLAELLKQRISIQMAS